MTYNQAIKYLFQLEFFGIKLGLSNIRRLLELLENPQDQLRAIHIAGTNGKGSVSSYVSNILQCSDYKVGLYTSPHLSRFEERITINGKVIPEETVARLTEKIKPIAIQVAKESNGAHPTFFEVTSAMAFLYFAEEKVDFAVIEVGMGGRLDATNVLNAKTCVITNIDFDHMKQLGTTLREIAREKAGIIKQNSTVITGASDEALEEIQIIAHSKHAKLIKFPKDISYRNLGMRNQTEYPDLPDYQKFYVFGQLGDYPNLKNRMLGEHQCFNATLAVGAVESVILNAFPELTMDGNLTLRNLRSYLESRQKRNQRVYTKDLTENAIPLAEKEHTESALTAISKILLKGIPEGIEKTQWPGRVEIVNKTPTVILDGAHNAAGARVLEKALKDLFKWNRMILVMGITDGKESNKIINSLCPLADEVVLTSAQHHHVIAPNLLFAQVKELGKPVRIVKKVADAVKYALEIARKNDLVCISGSLYVVGEAREIFVK